jgi:PPOX class probable F420-dependent enzyme
MEQSLEGPARALAESQGYCVVATTRTDGTIHTIVAWIGLDDDGLILLNSVEGRDWLANLRRTEAATVTVVDLQNPGEFASIQARLVRTSHDDAVAVINSLSNKILGMDYPLLRDDEQRVAVRLEPVHVVHQKMG